MRETSRPSPNKITVDQDVQGTIEISQLQHNDNVVNASVETTVQVSQVQVMMKTNRDLTVTARVLQDAENRQNFRIISASPLHLVTVG